MKLFKTDSETERLQAKLDALKSEQHRAASEAATKQAAEIAAVQAELDAAQRAEYLAKQQAQKDAQGQVLTDYNETVSAVVEAVRELDGLLTALGERKKQALMAGVPFKLALTDGLQKTVKAQLWTWEHQRPELVGAPPRPSRERSLVDTALFDLKDAEERLAHCRKAIEDYRGDRRGDIWRSVNHQFDNALGGWRQARENARRALAALGDEATNDDKRKRLELMESEPEPLTVHV